jgi:hypothetical protein
MLNQSPPGVCSEGAGAPLKKSKGYAMNWPRSVSKEVVKLAHG